MIEVNKIYHEDCLELLTKISNESIDCIVTDPPYIISKEGSKIGRNYQHYEWKRESNIKQDFGKWDRDWLTDKDYFDWVAEWFRECCRTLKQGGWIYIFFDKQRTGYFDLFFAPANDIKARTVYIWAKTNPAPSFRKVNWVSATESIWVGSKGDSKLKNFKYQKEMHNYFLYPNSSAYGETEHPTEKPLSLITHLIQVNSNENETILDPFIGSGTTAIACIRTKRNYIGIEKDKGYYDIACKRIEKEREQLTIL